jgi:hypothetical protein
MKACEAVEEKKRKRAVSGPSGGSSVGAPPKYRMIYTPPVGQLRRPPPQFLGNRPQQPQQHNCALPAQQQQQQVAVKPPQQFITCSTRLFLRNLVNLLMIALLDLNRLLAAYVHVTILLILIMNVLNNCSMLLMILLGHENYCFRGIR